jgi:hypothetical protein
MPVKSVSTTYFVCKYCPAYNFASTNISEYLNALHIFFVVLYTVCYLSLQSPYITTRRANAHPNILVILNTRNSLDQGYSIFLYVGCTHRHLSYHVILFLLFINYKKCIDNNYFKISQLPLQEISVHSSAIIYSSILTNIFKLYSLVLKPT